MKGRSRMILRVGIVLSLFIPVGVAPVVFAAQQAPLEFTQLNITGDEFIAIQNVENEPVTLHDYWLGYASSDVATAVPVQQLPDVTLQPQQSILLANGTVSTCGAVAVEDLSFSLSNTAGAIALWSLEDSNGSFRLLSSLSWGKAAGGPAYLRIADEKHVTQYNPLSALPMWLHQAGGWQVGDLQGCEFTAVTVLDEPLEPQSVEWTADNSIPPFTTLGPVALSGDSSGASIPAGDIGLKGLIFSELFPNPAKPQTDDADEFIELYNPNAKPFDLSGFSLQIVSATSTAVHKYTFPKNTKVAGHGLAAFKSSITHLALNNSAGQAWLVDPLGHTVSTSGSYSDVKEGMSWVKTGEGWQWTTQPTPGAANIVQATIQPTGSKKATVNGRAITGVAGTSKGDRVAGVQGASFDQAAQATPIHSATLAAVVFIALLYLAYEYRQDVANAFHEFRRNRGNRA